MWDKFRFLEFAFIILLILIGQIFLIQNDANSLGMGYWLASLYMDPFLLCAIIPIKIYSNAEQDKSKIINDNKNKSGIYMWKNINNGKQYIGSAVNLSERLWFYYSFKAIENLLKRSKSHICSALLIDGHPNFSLIILEYCEPSKCIERENFYLFSENHEYNILEKAGSSIGRKHYDETIKKNIWCSDRRK